MIKKYLAQLEKHHIFVFAILFLTFLMRFPSLFEPFWYGDEGIFAAVARNLNQGGILYQTAWDNKPPMIYLTYASIFSVFGVSMFWLRLVTTIVVLATLAVIYETASLTLGKKRALVAAFIFGLLTSLRLIEGNLALTEIFMILPISLAMYIAIKRKFSYYPLFIAGFLFAIASLYKQVGAFEAAALGVFIFLQNKNFLEFFKKGTMLSLGFAVPYFVTLLYFASKGLVSDYIFGAYTYYKIYLNESPQYAMLITVSKYLPVLSVIFYGIFKKIKKEKIEIIHLFFLWAAFSLLGSYFSGRTYGHYLVQATPAISLLLASVKFSKFYLNRARVVFVLTFFLPILFLTRLLFSDFLSGGPINQINYWKNFTSYVTGGKSVDSYNNYFDGNVNTIMALADSLKMKGVYGKSVYIWGDIPWLYAIDNFKNPSRYVTSFHVFGVPDGPAEVEANLNSNPPLYIIKPESSNGYFAALENILLKKYTLVEKLNSAEVYVLRNAQ